MIKNNDVNAKESSHLHNSFYLYLSNFSDYFISLLILPFIARKLGPEELGLVAFSQLFSMLQLLLMNFGLELTATRKIAKIKNEKQALKKFINKIYLFKILLIPFILFMSSLLLFLPSPISSKPHYVLIVLVGVIFQGLTPSWFFQGIEKIKHIAISKIFFRFVALVLIFFLVRLKNEGWIFLAINSFTSISIFIFLFLSMIKSIGMIKPYFLKDLISFLNELKSGFLITFIPIIHQNLIAFLVGLYFEPIKLGLFLGASKIYRSVNSLYGPAADAVYPRLISLNETNKNRSKQLLRNYFYFIFIVGLIIGVTIFLFAEKLSLTLLGPEFKGSEPLLKIFATVLPLTAISNAIGRQQMLVEMKEKKLLNVLILSLIFSIVFIFFTISFLGLNTLAFSLIIFEISSILLILFYRES